MAGKATPKGYAQAVLLHSRATPDLTLFPGYNYRSLADFLYSSYSPQSRRSSYSSLAKCLAEDSHTFAVLHKFSRDGAHEVLEYDSTTAGLEKLDLETQSGCDSGKILFLNGFAPSEWLNLIGSRYRIDPEFYRQHLSFMQPQGQLDLTSLPYASKNIVKLPFNTIGTWNIDGPPASQGIASSLRSLDATTPAGRSIVRKLTVNDQTRFTVEHEISICVETKDGGWTALCWLDGELDLDTTVFRSWLEYQKFPRHSHWMLPTYLYRPKIALSGPALVGGDGTAPYDPCRVFERTGRGLASLPRLYGGLLDVDCAQQDAFYALIELFALSAFSVNQSLNLLEQFIDSQLNSSIHDMQISLENLRQAKLIVTSHTSRLQQAMGFIRTRGSSAEWPRATAAKQEDLAKSAAEEIVHGYQHLLNRATSLTERIKDDSNWLMHKAMLNESQRAFAQGQKKITNDHIIKGTVYIAKL